MWGFGVLVSSIVKKIETNPKIFDEMQQQREQKKFKVDAKENLDDGFNNGIYAANDVTSDGNTASEDKMAVQLS